MHLEKLRIQNFRSFDDETIILNPGLTIFVGENNGGKSNAIDAARLITLPLSGRRELYCEPTDVRFDGVKRRFDIEGKFASLTPGQQGRFISVATDTTLQSAVFGITYDETKGQFPVRPTLWGGQHKVKPEEGSHDMVRHVYLPPLRDAKRALASGNPTRIHTLLKYFLGKSDPNEMVRRLQRNAKDPVLDSVDTAVEAGLKELTAGVRRQTASLGFANDEQLIDIARDLRFKLADHGIAPEDIDYSGHGYANLLYMATIAVELERIHTFELTLFLVEEPEAHLHPQLQAAVLCFLEEQAAKSRKEKEDKNASAGHLQVIVATHSPNLSAWVDSKNLVFFKSMNAPNPVAPALEVSAASEKFEGPAINKVEKLAPEALAQAGDPLETPETKTAITSADTEIEISTPVAPSITSPASRRITRTIPLSALNLTDIERRKIDRYIDVTKSAFMFGGRVLLVEGIAEALLFPVIAKHYLFKEDHDKYRQFRSSVFVPIEGVDFEPYVKVLLTPFEDIHIAERVVIVTDGDRTTEKDGEGTPGQARKSNLEKIATELKTADKLQVFINVYSLEAELVAAGNADVMKDVYLKLHPKSAENWNEAVGREGDERAAAIKGLFKSTRKGDFAQILAEKIVAGDAFTVPDYIKSAIEALVK